MNSRNSSKEIGPKKQAKVPLLSSAGEHLTIDHTQLNPTVDPLCLRVPPHLWPYDPHIEEKLALLK